MSSQVRTERPADDPTRPAGLYRDMVWLSGGAFQMGSDRHYPEEAPVHRVTVSPFWIDRTPVTNRQFRQFVEATGYIMLAEVAPDPKDYPGALPHILKPGSLVFTPPRHPVDLKDWSQWWRFESGANWRRPNGRGRSNRASTITRWCMSPTGTLKPMPFGRASTFRRKPSGSTPRGGLDGAEFAWGEERTPESCAHATTGPPVRRRPNHKGKDRRSHS